MKKFLGIDAGTSGIKAIVIGENGDLFGSGYSECDVDSPRPGWFEQSPEGWWTACDAAVRQAVAACGCGTDIAGIGFSGQMQGLVLLDRNGNSFTGSMIWMDQRSVAEADYFNSIIPPEELLSETGTFCLPSYFAPKLLWLKTHSPEVYEKADKVLFPKDYLRYRMTGEISTDVSDASCSFLLDIHSRKWSDRMFDVTGIPRSLFPDRIVESAEVTGTLMSCIADEWGIPAGIPVVAGGGDQLAGGVGNGITRNGEIAVTIGTSGVVFGCCDEPFIDSERHGIFSLCHSVPGKYVFLGLTLGAGSSFKWMRDTFFAESRKKIEENGGDIYDHMTGLAADTAPGCEGLLFLPYLNGETTPYVDPDARGVFFGLTARHDLGAMCRSVMEGVTYSLRDSVEILRGTGYSVSEVRAMGGGAKSALWRQIHADVFNAAVVRMNLEEGPAAGAAFLAAVGAGSYASVDEACSAILKVRDVTEPVAENVAVYNEYYECYHALYPALKTEFEGQAERVRRLMAD